MANLQSRLLDWYDHNARVLPWRSDPSPYRVWVSEIMLQQTRVETVLPYFERFMARFPDLASLANADLQELLRLWEGLGYYSRARNLHKAAQKIVEDHNGRLPKTSKELLNLPGIGKYTAAAIASIAFGETVAAVDGNIKRVYARVLGLAEPLGSRAFEDAIETYAQEALAKERPGDHTQALMDLGSSICLPQNPKCLLCPLQVDCLAFSEGLQEQLPVIPKKEAIPHYTVCVAAIVADDQVLLSQREQSGLLAGLWEFPGGKLDNEDASLEDCLRREISTKVGFELGKLEKAGVFRHAYTHFKITVHAWRVELLTYQELPIADNMRWVRLDELAIYPLGKVARLIAKKIS